MKIMEFGFGFVFFFVSIFFFFFFEAFLTREELPPSGRG